MITVTVGKVPGRVVEVELNDGATVEDAFAEADINTGKCVFEVGGEMGDADTELNDGDVVFAVGKIRGN